MSTCGWGALLWFVLIQNKTEWSDRLGNSDLLDVNPSCRVAGDGVRGEAGRNRGDQPEAGLVTVDDVEPARSRRKPARYHLCELSLCVPSYQQVEQVSARGGSGFDSARPNCNSTVVSRQYPPCLAMCVNPLDVTWPLVSKCYVFVAMR